MSVAELILNEGGWELDKLNQIGSLQEVDAILSVPLVRTRGEDHLMWNFNWHGKYSVKTEEWVLACPEENRSDGRSSS